MATSNSKLFGFKLPAVSKDDKSKAVVSPIPTNEEDKSDFYVSSGCLLYTSPSPRDH